MNWHSAADFFHMDGYGFFVWGSYGSALLWMLVEVGLARRRHARALHEVDVEDGA
ncbi:heme exporter protein CcmD [Paucibacter sp. B51]|uniref:heme exporter protein CcmD n=1 Tax=Paucibacter sp. B51 TaxID=2993315 RepID=UPI0022EBA7D6|nr:heme exporter protein CcmD [Paucibacter sp. B51]